MSIVLYWHPMSSATPIACALTELGVPHERVKRVGRDSCKKPQKRT